MNTTDIERIFNGNKPIPKSNDLYTLLGAVKVKDSKCPNCGESHNDNEVGYEVDNNQYPKYFNESKGSTMDGFYWDWDEVHCCENCEIKYWFSNGVY